MKTLFAKTECTPMRSSTANHKVSATQLSRLHKTTSKAVQERLIGFGFITNNCGIYSLSELGRSFGGEFRKSHPKAYDHEGYFVWPIDIISKTESGRIVMNRWLDDKIFTDMKFNTPQAAFISGLRVLFAPFVLVVLIVILINVAAPLF